MPARYWILAAWIAVAPFSQAEERVTRIREVRFAGALGLERHELRQALRATRARTIVPRIWKRYPAFTDAALNEDLVRLRSLYVSRGYFDASVVARRVEPDQIRFAIYSGRPAAVAETSVAGQAVPWGALCGCLLGKRRESWQQGQIDFSAALEVKPLPLETKRVDAILSPGKPFRVGRIDFRGHHSVRDSTLRNSLVIEEGWLFDPARLFESVGRLNRLGLFDPLGPDGVEISRDEQLRTAGITMSLKEKSKGRWLISGPLGPPSFAGGLQAEIGSRLPDWGPPVLKTSTYYASIGVTTLAFPAVFRALGLGPGKKLLPMIGIGRRYLPGQEWTSGFYLSPKMSWTNMLTRYGITQAKQRALTGLQDRRLLTPGMLVPVNGQATPGAVLLCEPQRSRWSWLREAGGLALDFL